VGVLGRSGDCNYSEWHEVSSGDESSCLDVSCAVVGSIVGGIGVRSNNYIRFARDRVLNRSNLALALHKYNRK